MARRRDSWTGAEATLDELQEFRLAIDRRSNFQPVKRQGRHQLGASFAQIDGVLFGGNRGFNLCGQKLMRHALYLAPAVRVMIVENHALADLEAHPL
jgi:hypothetical protein